MYVKLHAGPLDLNVAPKFIRVLKDKVVRVIPPYCFTVPSEGYYRFAHFSRAVRDLRITIEDLKVHSSIDSFIESFAELKSCYLTSITRAIPVKFKCDCLHCLRI